MTIKKKSMQYESLQLKEVGKCMVKFGTLIKEDNVTHVGYQGCYWKWPWQMYRICVTLTFIGPVPVLQETLSLEKICETYPVVLVEYTNLFFPDRWVFMYLKGRNLNGLHILHRNCKSDKCRNCKSCKYVY